MTGWNRSIFVFTLWSLSSLTAFSRLKFSMALVFRFAPAVRFLRSISCTVTFPSNTQRPLRHSMATSSTLAFRNLILSWLTLYSVIVFPEANNYSRCQEIPPVFWNTKVHYRVHKIQSLVCTWYHTKLSPTDRYLFLVIFNIIKPDLFLLSYKHSY